MSYWDRKMKELEEEEKKKKKKTVTPDSNDYWGKKMDELEKGSSTHSGSSGNTHGGGGGSFGGDIAPVKEDRKWFEKGAFEDGYQFGDVTKTLFSSARDLESNVFAGILGIGEKVVDAGAYLVGGAADLVGADKFADKTKDFIAKDLYDEKKVADKILGIRDISSIVDTVASKSSGKSFYGEENSVFGDKTDALAQSGGQLLATAGLQMVGVPWYLTTGVTSFGAETENAFNQGATYGQAGLSATISAGAEILTEKLSGGIKFGGKALDEGLTKVLTTNISNKALRTMAKLGMDVVGEGTEEVISQVFSNLGSALYREEDLSEIMFSEEAFDEYLESFIGGAVLGGTGTVTGVVKGNVTGRDVTSGLTANEEKVLKQIYDERIKEAEQDGKKLTAKEKNAIYDEIKGEMEKGYISTDKIESILGGDTYKAYQDTIAKEDAAIEELKTLYTGEELDRAVRDILDNSKRTEIKNKLSQEVADLATNGKDTYLSESYNEAARRKETFTADLTNYDAKAQETIKKAIESGILNNTRRTHEFVDMVAKISADKGVLFDFTNNQKLAESGFAVEGKSVNGFVTKDGVTLNIDSQKALNSTVGHEITHVLEGTEFYDALQETIFEYAKTKGVYEDMLRNTKSLYENIEGYKGVDGFNAIKREVVSDLVGDYLFTDPDFINHLSGNRNVFQKIYDEIKYLYKVATAGSKEARELAKVKRAFEKAYQAEGKADGETKYSVSDKNIKDVSTGYGYGETYFTMSYTQDGKTVAKLDYGVYEDAPNVKMVEVDPEYRRKGIATKLLQELQKKYPEAEIDFGMTTPDGTKLLDSITYNVTDEAIAADQQKLKSLQTELDELQGKLDVLYDTETLTEAQETELEKLGDRWEEVYHEIYDLENSLRGKKAKKTFVKYSVSDSDGTKLTKEQSEYFKDSKMRDENGALKVMYHGSQNAGFHVFDPSMSDDGTSLFFVDRNDVAASYSGTTETYAAKTIKTIDDFNKFAESIDVEGYEVTEKDGKFTLFYEGDEVATRDTMQEIYEEFCWYEGVGDGDANYKVYLNLTNPLEVDAKGKNWNNISREYSEEVAGRYNSLTAEEKEALSGLAEWEDFQLFRDEIISVMENESKGNVYEESRHIASAIQKLGGSNINISNLFSIASDNFSAEAIKEFAVKQMNTRDYAQKAKAEGYDGVIFKNIHDNGGYSNGSEGASTVAIAFDSNQVKSVENASPTGHDDIRYSLSRNAELMQNAENSNRLGIDLATAKEQRQAIYEYMTKNADRLKLPEDIEGNTAIKNSSYDISEENTTVCIRSMAADALCDAVAEELGRPLTVQDTLKISQDLMNYTDEPECVYCYVATDRRAYREFLGSYYKQMESAVEALRSGKNPEEVYEAFRDGRKDTKPMRDRFAMWQKIANGAEMISAKDLASERTMQAAMKDPALAAQVKDARKYAQNASWAKKRMGYQSYDGHILKWSQKRVNDLNKHYGLRFYSFSDFSPAFVLENMQQMTDAAVRGLKGLAYTKVLDFAEIFAPTGVNINISVFGYNQNGAVAQDGMMGADWKGAQDLRNRYENVGITFVATNDTQINWALDQDWIDVVIPYHLVRTGKAVAKHFGYTNYTDVSGDTKGADWKKGDKKTIYPSEHNNDKQTYLKALAEAHLEPRFADWVDHPNYMKLVNETRRSAKDTPPLKAVFNVDAAKASLDRMAKQGGYFVPIGGDYAEMNDIAKEIADEIRAPKYSLSEGKSYGRYNVYGDDVRLEKDIAPVGETSQTVGEIAPVADGLGSLDSSLGSNYPKYDLSPEAMPVGANESEIARLEARAEELERTMLERYQAGYATLEEASALYREYMQTLNKIDDLKAQAAEAETQNAKRLETLNEAPPEAESPYYGDTEEIAPSDPFESRDYKAVGNQKQKAYMYENPEVKPFFQAEANVMLGELQRTTKGERWYNDQVYYETNGEKGFSGTKRHTSPDIAYLLDEGRGNGHGYTYAEIEKGLKAIIEDNGKENNACSKRIEFILNDRLLKGYPDMDGLDVPADENYVKLIREKEISEYSNEARQKYFEANDALAPVGEQMKLFDDPKPEKTEYKPYRAEQKKLFDDPKEEKVAEVMVGEPEAPKQKKRSKWITNYVDKGSAVESLALKTKNRELQAKYNFMHYSENRAQSYIKNNLKPLLDKIEKTGKTKEVYEYAYHLHNIDRMSLDTKENQAKREELRGKYFDGMSDKMIENAAKQWITHKTPKETAERIKAAREYMDTLKTKNKPVYGDSVTADVSRKKVQQYEAANPEFIEIGRELVAYNTALRQLMVENNLISQETADLWAKEYPHYVPIRRIDHEGAAVNVPLDSRKTTVNAPIKRATGGNSDIGDLGDTMAMRTEQIFKAIARNNFGLELMHTLDSVVEENDSSLEEVTESLDKQDELLKKGENGNAPTFTVFKNGKRVEFEITEELYDSMKPTSDELSKTHLSSKAVEAFKKVTTQYNPKFMVSNPIKDAQDIILNSQHPLKTYANMPKAFYELATNGRYFREYMENGGEQNTYFDRNTKSFKKEDGAIMKVVKGLPRGINMANDFMERAPRLAEYMASRKKGASIEVAMLDAARVTTNFSAGGDVTKYVGRNFVPFLNPSVQGAAQQVRNVREASADGLSGVLKLAGKYAIAGIPAVMLNALLWDDDEEYDDLSDYVKENYYVVAKFDDGKFVRIPKGRTVAVLQSAVEQTLNAIQGGEADFGKTGKLALSNLAPNNPLENNILSTLTQIQTNTSWYGEDIVPTRLQDMPEAEQYDESTDLISKWLAEKLSAVGVNASPMKINYLIDQYTGGIGDMILPMLTPETTSGETTLGDYAIAPWKDLFTTDSVLKNQNVSDFYDTVDKLTKNANSMYATDEDILASKYMNAINSSLGELYKKKRDIQSDTTIPAGRKYNLVRRIQQQIDNITKDALNTYGNVSISDGYATVGDLHYRKNDNGAWEKVSDKQLEKQENVTRGLGITPSEYWGNKEEYDYAYDYPGKYSLAKAVGGYESFKTYSSELYDIKSDKDASGKTITGSRKKKVVAYINNLDADYYEKIILFKSEYTADDTYNYEIINYLNERDDISYKEMEMILKELGFTVDSKGNISW